MEEKKKEQGGATVAENAGGWWSGIVGEFKRINWPNRSQLVKLTIAAIVTSGILGAIIVGYDFGLAQGYTGLSRLVSTLFTRG